MSETGEGHTQVLRKTPKTRKPEDIPLAGGKSKLIHVLSCPASWYECVWHTCGYVCIVCISDMYIHVWCMWCGAHVCMLYVYVCVTDCFPPSSKFPRETTQTQIPKPYS